MDKIEYCDQKWDDFIRGRIPSVIEPIPDFDQERADGGDVTGVWSLVGVLPPNETTPSPIYPSSTRDLHPFQPGEHVFLIGSSRCSIRVFSIFSSS